MTIPESGPLNIVDWLNSDDWLVHLTREAGMTPFENTASGRLQAPAGSVKESGTHTVAKVLGGSSHPSSPRAGGKSGMQVKIPSVRDVSKVR